AAPVQLLPPRQASTVGAVAFGKEGALLATGSNDNTVVLWSVASRQPLDLPLEQHRDDVRALAFSHDGRTLATAGGDGVVLLSDVATGRRVGPERRQHGASVWGVAFDPTDQMLASGGADQNVFLWRFNRGAPLETLIAQACGTANRELT